MYLFGCTQFSNSLCSITSNTSEFLYVLNSPKIRGRYLMQFVDYSYEGFYARFEAADQKQGGLLMGADNLVGDDYEVFFKTENGINIAWVKNRFGAEVGFFDIEVSRKIQLAQGRGQTIRALLAYVGFSDMPEPGNYWGQMALFCFNPAYAKEMNSFVDRCSSKMAEGIRPKIDLGSSAVEKIFSEKDWLPSETIPLPKKVSGTAILKDHRSMSEKVIEQGRAGNKGCYFISWAFIAVVVVVILYFILHMLQVI